MGTAILFFEVVPKLSTQNFDYANNELVDALRKFASEDNVSHSILSDGETTIDRYEIRLIDLAIVGGLLGKSTHVLMGASYMHRSSLGALVSEYEGFLSNLLRLVGKCNPSAFVNSSDSITLAELDTFSSLEDIKSELVSAKIDDLLHSKSHVQMLEWMSDAFGVNLTSDKVLIAEFSEICQRRHLLTHAGGFVNKRYLKICRESGLCEDQLPAIGEKVMIGRHYLRKATARVFQVGFFTLHIMWQKLFPNELEDSCGQILSASHDFLENDLTKMCTRLAKFVTSAKRLPSDRIVSSLVVNQALAQLYDPKLDDEERKLRIAEILSTRDWSMMTPTFRLALACINREFDDLENLAKSAYEDGVDYHAANTWVVFREARTRPEFLPVFKRQS